MFQQRSNALHIFTCFGRKNEKQIIAEKELTIFRSTDIILLVIIMNINSVLKDNNMTMYRLSKLSGVPHATLNNICSGQAKIEKCSAETLYRIAKVLNVSVEDLIKDAIAQSDLKAQQERSYEYGLPAYLQKDLDEYKKGLKNHSSLLDCLWGELYGSINMAEISDGVISHEQADYLRQKYLWRN